MSKQLLKELPHLVINGVIGQDVADKITAHYAAKPDKAQSRMLLIFSILGALLVSLGVILILAHNWDEMSRLTKTIIAFIPLVAAQALCFYTITNREDSKAWREACGTLLFFAVGTSISLVSQIYNIPGNISSFMLTWLVLTIPLVYIMRSSMVSLLALAALTYYGAVLGYDNWPRETPVFYWLLLPTLVPYYIMQYKENPKSNFLAFHHWFFPISLLICLGTVSQDDEASYLITYMSGLGIIYLLGNSPMFKDLNLRSNGYKILGSLGTLWILILSSYEWLWKEVIDDMTLLTDPGSAWFSLVVTLVAVGLLIYQRKDKGFTELAAAEVTFLIYLVAVALGLAHPVASMVLINLVVLAIGLTTVRIGGQKDHLGIINYGLLVITVLLFARFVDTNIGYLLRGIIFIGVGVMFFMVNKWIINRRKNEKGA